MLFMRRQKFQKGDGKGVQQECFDFWRTHFDSGRNLERFATYMHLTEEEVLEQKKIEKEHALEEAAKKKRKLKRSQQPRIQSFFLPRRSAISQRSATASDQSQCSFECDDSEKMPTPAVNTVRNSTGTSSSSSEIPCSEELLAFVSSVNGDPDAFVNAGIIARGFEGIPEIYYSTRDALVDYEAQSKRMRRTSELGQIMAKYKQVASKLECCIVEYCAAFTQIRSTLCVDDVKQHLMCVKKKKNSRKRKRRC